MRKHKALFWIGVTLAVIIVAVVIVYNQDRPAEGPSALQSKYWQERVAEIGALNAYEEFAESVEEETQNKQHDYAHIFGGALYEEEKVGAIGVCDTRFSYGCFHEFLGRAIAELGLDSVPKLNSACIDMLGNEAHFCQHGVGHGLQSYFGYSKKDLFAALDSCSSLPDNDTIGGCSGGIFMEYNFRTMLADDAVVRDFTSDDTLCSEVKPGNKESCVFWQPQWWHGTLGYGDTEETFSKLGELCHETTSVSSDYFVSTCFRGIGNIATQAAQLNREKTLRLCRSVSSNPEDISDCVNQAETAL